MYDGKNITSNNYYEHEFSMSCLPNTGRKCIQLLAEYVIVNDMKGIHACMPISKS